MDHHPNRTRAAKHADGVRDPDIDAGSSSDYQVGYSDGYDAGYKSAVADRDADAGNRRAAINSFADGDGQARND